MILLHYAEILIFFTDQSDSKYIYIFYYIK